MLRTKKIRCPLCGNNLVRVHRRSLERLIGLVLPIRRYRCQQSNCHWEGLHIQQLQKWIPPNRIRLIKVWMAVVMLAVLGICSTIYLISGMDQGYSYKSQDNHHQGSGKR